MGYTPASTHYAHFAKWLAFRGPLLCALWRKNMTTTDNPLAITDRLVPLNEACIAAGGVNRSTLYRWTKQGVFPKFRKAGARTGVMLSELNVWLRERCAV
jgi:predicted DNA-binding transcriptional regulator AlpA